jgi:hypothetical protein
MTQKTLTLRYGAWQTFTEMECGSALTVHILRADITLNQGLL